MKTNKTWLITGASKGIGFELVRQALSNGDNVIAASRNIEGLKVAFNNSSERFLPVEVEISNEESVRNMIALGIKQFGKIDCVVNNAAYGFLGGIEESSNEEARANFDINVFGLLNVTRAVLPYMREAGQGHIFNMSSVFGLVAGAAWGIYCATKFAVEGLSEALEQEVKPFGIHVTIIEPGYFRTSFLDSGSVKTAAEPISDYSELTEIKRKHLFEIPGQQIGNPVKAASVILEISLLEQPPMRLLLGSDAMAYAEDKIDRLQKGLLENKVLSASTDYLSEELTT